jgi:hypothetical protein
VYEASWAFACDILKVVGHSNELLHAALFRSAYGTGREAIHQFGHYPLITLVSTKLHRNLLFNGLASGKDPVSACRSRRTQTAHSELSFDQRAAQYIEVKRPEWKNSKHEQQLTKTHSSYASPVFARINITDGTLDQVTASSLG